MADIINLNFKADGDFGPFIAQVNRAMAALSKFRNEKLLDPSLGLDKNKFDQAVFSFRDLVSQTGLYNSQIVNITSSTEKFGKSLSAQNLKLKEYYKAYVDFRRSTVGQIRALAQEQVRIQNSVVKTLGRDASGAARAMVITPTGIDALSNASRIAAQETMIFNKVLRDGATSLINWGKNTQWAGRQLTVGLTLPIMIFGKTAAEAFRRADQELTRLAKVYGGIGETSAAELAMVRQNVSDLAKTLASSYGASFEETLGLAADIAATGAEGADLLSATAETTRLATLGEVDRQEAMKATLALQSAFKLNTQELTESINLLNAVENQTSTTLQDLVEAIPKAGPVIKGLGGDVGTLALFLTAMREGGINAAEGANALKSGLASLINPTKQAVEKMQSFGININEIVNSNAGDLVGLIFDLQAALDKLDPLQKQQAIEQLFGKYQFARIGALLNNIGREGSQSLQVLDIVKASTQDLAATADRELTALTESASGRYKRALETFKATLAEFGEPFLDIFANILKVGSKVLKIFGSMPEPIKMFMTGLAGVTALAGPLIMLTGIFGNFLGYIIKGVAAFRQLRSGAGAFELITTSTVAADQVADAYTRTQYDQITATKLLRAELEKLSLAYSQIAGASRIGAPGPRPPDGGGPSGTGGGGGIIPPIIPMGPVVSTSASRVGSVREAITADAAEAIALTEQSIEDIRVKSIVDAEKTVMAKLEKMSPAERTKYLETMPSATQALLQKRRIGHGRTSGAGNEIALIEAAARKQRGLMGPGLRVAGVFREGTGAEEFGLLEQVGGHADPLLKEEMATAGKYAADRSSYGGTGMPNWLNQALGKSKFKGAGRRPTQAPIMTEEGLIASAIAYEALKADTRTAGELERTGKSNPLARAKRLFKAGQITVEGQRPTVSGAEAKALKQQLATVAQTPRTPAPVIAPIPLGTTAQETVSTSDPVAKSIKRKNKKIERDNLRNQKALAKEMSRAGDSAKDLEKSSKSVEKSTRQTSVHAKKYVTSISAAVGSVGMLSSMALGMSGSTNQMAMNMANFLMYAGFATPAIKGLGAGLKTVGASLSNKVGLVGMLGRGLAFLGTGPGMIAVGVLTALGLGIKKLYDNYKETIAKAKSDIYVAEEALAAFGGAALSAESKFANYVNTVNALKQNLIQKTDVRSALGLPTAEDIKKIEEQVKELFKNQIKRLKDISTKEEAMSFARNLKATLVSQGVEEKAASTVIASIFEQAGKQTLSVPVLLDIAGLTTKDQAIEQLKKAAQITFNDIADGIESGSISRKLAERFSEQLDLLSAAALSQINDFEDLASVINYLPEGMKNLTYEQLNSTYAGQKLLDAIKDTNPELYKAFKQAEDLATAIQLAAAQSMGLSTTLGGVAGQFAIAAQNAMSIVTTQELAQSGIQGYYNRLINSENKTIAKLRQRMKAELEAADNRKRAIDQEIDLEKEKIDAVKEEADARRDLLREKQKEKDFEVEMAELRIKQNISMQVGNFAEAAMIGLDIEKKMQDRSVDLAEKAINEKEKREIELHENKIELLEKEKEAIKELTDEQKASIESRYNKLIETHNKAIEKYRQDAINSANTFKKLFSEAAAGNVESYNKLKELLKTTGNDINTLGGTFSAFLTKTMQSFSKAFGDSLASILGPGYRVQDGQIQMAKKVPGPKGRGMRTVWETISTIAKMFGLPTYGIGGMPNGTGITIGDDKIQGALGDQFSDSQAGQQVETIYGTFTIKKRPNGQLYVQYRNRLNNKIEDINGYSKQYIEQMLAGSMVPMAQVQPLYKGGQISGPGTSTSDSIPILASNGEYMMSAAAVQNAGGPAVMDFIHEYFKNAPRMKAGGKVPSMGTPDPNQSFLNEFLFGTRYIGGNMKELKGEVPFGPGSIVKLSKAFSKTFKDFDIDFTPGSIPDLKSVIGRYNGAPLTLENYFDAVKSGGKWPMIPEHPAEVAGGSLNALRVFQKGLGEEIGALKWDPFSGIVSTLNVSPKFQRQGIATELWRIASGLGGPLAHSATRTQMGDTWAKKVGGIIPELGQLLPKMANGGYIGKLHTWNGPVPGPYGSEVAATLKAGTEGVYQTRYINSLQKESGSDCNYYINVSVTNPGATPDQIANAIEAKMRLREQRVGYSRTVTI